MAPQSSFADSTIVQKSANDLKSLSNEAVNLEEDVFKAKTNARDLDIVKKYNSDFPIINKIFDSFADNIRKQNNTARDVATKIRAQLDLYLVILKAIEEITKKEEVNDIIDTLNHDIKAPNPLQKTPLDGFQSVTDEFNRIWALKNDESKHIVDVLEKATDIKEIIEKLVAEFKSVKDGIAKVQDGLRYYASHIHN